METLCRTVPAGTSKNDYLSELAQVLFIGWFEEHAGEREIASLTDGGDFALESPMVLTKAPKPILMEFIPCSQ